MLNMEEFTPNSHKFKESQKETSGEKKVEKVISGKAKVKKKNGASKFAETFLSEDVSNVKSYVIQDVLIPAAKKLVSDIVTNGIDMILYGESGRSKKRTNADYVSYRSYSDSKSRPAEPRTRAGYRYDELIFESRGDAEEVLTRMDELVETYGMVSIADFYEAAGEPCKYTDNYYGWTDIRHADVNRVRDGYVIKLPKAISLK
jgi:hypothetical protein